MASKTRLNYGKDLASSKNELDLSVLTDTSPINVLSMNPGYPIKINRKSTPWSSSSIMNLVARNGGRIHTLPYEIYDRRSLESKRLLNGDDLMKGREDVLFHDFSHFREIYSDLGKHIPQFVEDLKNKAKKGSLVAAMDLQDMAKINVQRVYSKGVRFDLHFEDGIKRDKYPPKFQAIVEKILDHYISLAGDVAKLGSPRLRLLDSDPPDTSLGLYPSVPEGGVHGGRLLKLSALDFSKGPAGMFEALRGVASQMGMPDFMGSAIKKAYRFRTAGPDKKTDIIVFNGSEYVAKYEASGLMNLGRSVWQFEYTINYVLSPLYLFMKSARSRKQGMFHTSAMLNHTVKFLRNQFIEGRIPVAVDQSAQDKHIGKHFFYMIADHLIKRGILKDEAELIKQLPDNTTALIPHPNGPQRGTLAVSGISGMPSGLKLTSEIDTLHNLSCAMYIMEMIEPGATDRWIGNKLLYPAQGDDGLLMLRPQDVPKLEKATKIAENDLGISIKLFEDALFLKMMLPLTKELDSITRPISRGIQNSVFNEDRHTGIPSGNTPDCVMRVGLASRLELLRKNPYGMSIWPIVCPILMKLAYIERSTPEFKQAFKKGEVLLSEKDKEGVLLYATKVPTYAERLVARSKYDPGAMKMLEFLARSGIHLESVIPPNIEIRKAYEKALISKPSFKSITEMAQKTGWLGRNRR